ncbi:MAG: GNAT family N-acetyltransferase [Phycisphaerales bacterium]
MVEFVPKRAAKSDLDAVLRWLKREESWTALVTSGSFWHHREIICRARSDGELYVLVSGGKVGAFLVGSLSGDLSIMEVRPELRGFGLGRMLVEYYLDQIEEAGGLGATVECEPSSSIPFWKQLGFKAEGLIPAQPNLPRDYVDGPPRLARVFPARLQLSPDALRHPFEVCLCDLPTSSLTSTPHRTQAAREGGEWRLVDPYGALIESSETYVRVYVDGREVWCDKVKRIDRVGGERSRGMTRLRRFHEVQNADEHSPRP